MIDSEKTTDIVDTTDCLEAVGAFKAMKNFLFTVSIICLFLLQICFILDRLGYIDKTRCFCQSTSVSCAGSGCALAPEQIIPNDEPQGPPLPDLDKPSDQTQTDVIDKISADAEVATENAAEQEQDIRQPVESSGSDNKKISEMLMPRARHIAALIKTCNFILIITVTLYSLMLLMILKISLLTLCTCHSAAVAALLPVRYRRRNLCTKGIAVLMQFLLCLLSGRDHLLLS